MANVAEKTEKKRVVHILLKGFGILQYLFWHMDHIEEQLKTGRERDRDREAETKREREAERQRDRKREGESVYVCMYERGKVVYKRGVCACEYREDKKSEI